MRLVMMGTGPFAVPTLASLLESPHQVIALVTRPSVVAQTRGKSKAAPNPMRELAQSGGLKVIDPVKVNDAPSVQQLADLEPELLVVCDYGQILAPETLTVAPLGGINLHGSLLPKYRGAAPIQWALWRGEQETGVTVIHMTPRLDAGPTLRQISTAIGPTETAAELEPRLAKLGVPLIHEAIALLETWDRSSPIGVIQDQSLATRAPRLKKEHGNVDWSRSAAEIFNQFRAVQPWPGLFSHFVRVGKEPLRVILEQLAPVSAGPSQPPGSVSQDDRHELLVATGEGTVAIPRLQPAGKRSMPASEFFRGSPLQPGDRFVSDPGGKGT